MATEGGLPPGGGCLGCPYGNDNTAREGGGGSSGHKANGMVMARQASPLSRDDNGRGELLLLLFPLAASTTNKPKSFFLDNDDVDTNNNSVDGK